MKPDSSRREQCRARPPIPQHHHVRGNFQIGAFLTYAAPLGRSFLGRELYLPEAWPAHEERCMRAGVPETTAIKPVLTEGMVERALYVDIQVGDVHAVGEAFGVVELAG